MPALNDPATFQVPAGFEKINGAEFNTAEKQAASFENIQAVGQVGTAGSYLIGRKKTPAAAASPAGFQQIPGAHYDTTQKQQGAFSDIRPVGQVGAPGSFLIGKPRSQTITLPNGTVTVDGGTGQIVPGGASLTGDGSTPTLDQLKGTAAAGTGADAITKLITDFETSNAEYQKQILAATTPSQKENDIQKQIDELSAAVKGGKVNIEGRAIPIEDIAGQEGELVRNANALLEPLNSALSREQTGRQGVLSKLTQALGFQGQNQQLQLEKAKLLQQPFIDASKAVREYLLNLATKYPDAGITLEDTADSAAKKAAASASFKSTITKADTTTDIKEYQYAKDQGFSGTLLDYQQKKAEIGAADKWQLTFDGAGNPFTFNPVTKQLEPYNPSAGIGGTSGGATGSPTIPRTLRNNNPIAAAVPVGGTNEYTNALDKAGIKWSYGDAFPDDPKMATIRIQGDGVEGSRAILSNTGALENWYLKPGRTGADIPKKYGISNHTQFSAAPEAVQNAIMNDLFRSENGFTTHTLATGAFVPKTSALDKQVQLRIAQTKSDFASVGAAVAEIGKLVPSVIRAADPLGAALQLVALNFGAVTGMDENARLLRSKIIGLRSLVSRGLGEKGAMTEGDIGRITALLPSFGDTASVANKKISDLTKLIAQIQQEKISAYQSVQPGGGAGEQDLSDPEAAAYLDSLGL